MSQTNARPPTPMSPKQEDFILLLARRVWGTKEGPERLASFKKVNGGAPTALQASAEIKRIQSLLTTPKAKATDVTGHATTGAPAGGYAVRKDGAMVVVRLSKPTEGKWAGMSFLTNEPAVTGMEALPIRGDAARFILNEIQAEPFHAAANYGRMTGRCPVCRRQLPAVLKQARVGVHTECMASLPAEL